MLTTQNLRVSFHCASHQKFQHQWKCQRYINMQMTENIVWFYLSSVIVFKSNTNKNGAGKPRAPQIKSITTGKHYNIVVCCPTLKCCYLKSSKHIQVKASSCLGIRLTGSRWWWCFPVPCWCCSHLILLFCVTLIIFCKNIEQEV